MVDQGLDQPCRESDQPYFRFDRAYGGMEDLGLDLGTTVSNKIGQETTSFRPFPGFRIPTKLL